MDLLKMGVNVHLIEAMVVSGRFLADHIPRKFKTQHLLLPFYWLKKEHNSVVDPGGCHSICAVL